MWGDKVMGEEIVRRQYVSKFVDFMWLTIVGVRNLITLEVQGDLRDRYLRMTRDVRLVRSEGSLQVSRKCWARVCRRRVAVGFL
jgi:hypothetical protein